LRQGGGVPLRFVSKQGKAQGIRTVEILRTTVSKTVVFETLAFVPPPNFTVVDPLEKKWSFR
jgi:hypothetical protein